MNSEFALHCYVHAYIIRIHVTKGIEGFRYSTYIQPEHVHTDTDTHVHKEAVTHMHIHTYSPIHV